MITDADGRRVEKDFYFRHGVDVAELVRQQEALEQLIDYAFANKQSQPRLWELAETAMPIADVVQAMIEQYH